MPLRVQERARTRGLVWRVRVEPRRMPAAAPLQLQMLSVLLLARVNASGHP